MWAWSAAPVLPKAATRSSASISIGSGSSSCNRGEVPIYEPGLEELVRRNVKEGRLSFTTELAPAVQHSMVSFIAVGTPMSASGAADLTGVLKAAEGGRKGRQRLSYHCGQEHGAGRHQ